MHSCYHDRGCSSTPQFPRDALQRDLQKSDVCHGTAFVIFTMKHLESCMLLPGASWLCQTHACLTAPGLFPGTDHYHPVRGNHLSLGRIRVSMWLAI